MPATAPARRPISLAAVRIGAVIEIADEGGDLPLELIAAAYRVSRWALVVLLLNGVERQRVDRALNPVVAAVGLRVHGILYLEAWTTAELLELVRAAPVVVARTESLRAELAARRIPFVCGSTASAVLHRLLAPTEAPPD